MARSIFQITLPSGSTDSMRLDSKNHGEAVFAVKNIKGEKVRGRALITLPKDPKLPKGQEPKETKWIRVEGNAEREFDVTTTEQFTVSVDVPKDAAPGKYSFRFDAQNVNNTDEEYTQGPSINFSILAPVGPTPGPKVPLWLILLLVFVLLVIIGVVVWLIVGHSGSGGGGPQPTATASEKVAVPNVGGGTKLDDAEQQIKDQGLTPSVEEQASKDFQKGQVIRTEPPAGSEVEPGSTVKLLVAGQTVVVPANLVGMACPNAANSVGQLGLIPDLVGDGKATKLDCSSSALVSSVNPLGGQPVLAGSHVSLVIPGPHLVRMTWDTFRLHAGVFEKPGTLGKPEILQKMHK